MEVQAANPIASATAKGGRAVDRALQTHTCETVSSMEAKEWSGPGHGLEQARSLGTDRHRAAVRAKSHVKEGPGEVPGTQ